MVYRDLVRMVGVLAMLCTAGSFAAQYVWLMNPCPLCILQRLAVMAVMLLSGLCLILPLMRRWMQCLVACLLTVPALWGMGVAVYQLRLQSLPDMQRPSCGAPWSFRLRNWPLFDAWEPVVRGMGDCAEPAVALGLPLPVWTLLFGLTVLCLLWGGLLRCRR